MDEMGFFAITSDRARALWNDYRAARFQHALAIKKTAAEIGAEEIWIAGGGGICGATFISAVHPAFSATQRGKHGTHNLKYRGRSTEEKQAIADFAKVNEGLRALFPSERDIAEREGFIKSLAYEGADCKGFRHISHAFNWAQALWFSEDSEIILFAPDAAAAIAADNANGYVTTPASWSIPDGYTQITQADYEFRRAKYRFEREQAAAKEAMNHG